MLLHLSNGEFQRVVIYCVMPAFLLLLAILIAWFDE